MPYNLADTPLVTKVLRFPSVWPQIEQPSTPPGGNGKEEGKEQPLTARYVLGHPVRRKRLLVWGTEMRLATVLSHQLSCAGLDRKPNNPRQCRRYLSDRRSCSRCKIWGFPITVVLPGLFLRVSESFLQDCLLQETMVTTC